MNKLNKIAAGIALTSTLIAGQAFAADQGTLGATSTGKSDITLTIADQVQITGVDDIVLGTFDGTTALNGSTSFCVYTNGAGDYQMTLTESISSAFVASSVATGDTVPFSVKVDNSNSADPAGASALAYNTPSSAYAGSDELDCGASENASIYVEFSAADLRTAGTATDYKATVVVLVEPV